MVQGIKFELNRWFEQSRRVVFFSQIDLLWLHPHIGTFLKYLLTILRRVTGRSIWLLIIFLTSLTLFFYFFFKLSTSRKRSMFRCTVIENHIGTIYCTELLHDFVTPSRLVEDFYRNCWRDQRTNWVRWTNDWETSILKELMNIES